MQNQKDVKYAHSNWFHCHFGGALVIFFGGYGFPLLDSSSLCSLLCMVGDLRVMFQPLYDTRLILFSKTKCFMIAQGNALLPPALILYMGPFGVFRI